jgi:hypothetical protein
MRDYEKQILGGIADARRTGLLCLSVSTFLYIGSLLPKYQNETEHLLVLQGSSFLFLISAGLFYWRTVILRNKLNH